MDTKRVVLKALLVGVVAVACMSLLPACGGSSTTAAPAPAPTPSPDPQGIQIENSNMSMVAITRIGVTDLGSGNLTWHTYAVAPGNRGPVISLPVGNYEWYAEYVVAGVYYFTRTFFAGVSSGAVTLQTLTIS